MNLLLIEHSMINVNYPKHDTYIYKLSKIFGVIPFLYKAMLSAKSDIKADNFVFV